MSRGEFRTPSGAPTLEGDVSMFLRDLRLGVYEGAFVAQGYDDLSFLVTLGNQDIMEMLDDCNIHKPGHRKKVKVGLQRWSRGRDEGV